MKQEIKDFKRLELFKHYNSRSNPFIILTTKVDITNLYYLGKKNKAMYATIGYCLNKVANEIDEFKYRFEDNKIYKYDVLKPNFTEMYDDHTIGFFTCNNQDNYDDFLDEYHIIHDKFMRTHESYANEDQGEVWFSCIPWFNISSLIPPFDNSMTIPQFIWDRFIMENDHVYINLMIMVHHGFCDGYHISLFLNKFNELINNIKKDD